VTKLAIDMSSYLKTALLTGKDTKDGLTVVFEDKPVLVNSAEYGYEIVTNMLTKTLQETNLQPIDCILVFEGMQSKSKRVLMDPKYKGNRDARPPEFYEEFVRLRDFIEEQWRGLGAMTAQQPYAEADDTLAWLARETEEDLIIASRDGDLGVLNTEHGQTNAYGATVKVYNDGLLGIPKLGGEVFTHPYKYIHLYKALVGDTSDSIPGAKGFGPKSFQKLAEKYGYDGLDELVSLLEKGDLDPLHAMIEEPEHKLLKPIVEHEADVIRSFRVAKLYPEWVNTMKHPLEFRMGKVVPLPSDADSRLKHWYGLSYLVTAENYEEAKAYIAELAAQSPDVVFDIETTTPPESDEWLAAQGNPDGVDQIGSTLVGFSLTVGSNMQHTFYVTVAHAKSANIKMSQARTLLEAVTATGKEIVIHNTHFELAVLNMAQDEDGSYWRDHWKDNGYFGFLPNALDTKIEANYVDENIPSGLKFRSKHHLGYEQATFQDTTRKIGHPSELPAGGRLVREEASPDGGEPVQIRQYKMHELTADEVFAYGCDDTICTSALHRGFKLLMQLEHHYHVYLQTEIKAAYQHAKNFNDGMCFSLETSKKLEAHDDETYDKAWATVRAYLIKHGWEGTIPPVYGQDITAAQIKEAYKIIQGYQGEDGGAELSLLPTDSEDDDAQPVAAADDDDEPNEDSVDEFLKSKIRTPAKLVTLARELGHEVFAGMVERCMQGDHEYFTSWVNEAFSGEPHFTISNKQVTKLLYEVMKLPVRVRNKPTEKMRKEGKSGNPKADALAIEYALREADDEQREVLQGLKLMQMVKTRRGLYYLKYPYFIHWLTGRIHPSHNQSHTNTRRASEAKPNKQQLPKHPKISGEPARFRETIVPHHPDAVIVSLDFDSQELRVIADYSKDENMVAAFVGENKKSLHSLTGHSIATKKRLVTITYEEFDKAAKDKNHPLYAVCSEYRALGKKVNFTTEFGAMAPKLALTMLVPEAEAQTYIDAKEAMFPGVRVWKNATIADAKRVGYVRTKCGAVRHLARFFNGDDYWLKSKAERQAVNFKVQSSSAEMTKQAEGRMWEKGLTFKYNCVCYGPVHDETVFSVLRKDLVAFLKDAHWCMVQPYADMVIPIESSISFGPNFGQQIEIGSVPSKEAVEYGFEQWQKIIV